MPAVAEWFEDKLTAEVLADLSGWRAAQQDPVMCHRFPPSGAIDENHTRRRALR
jgi:hypothetical protein